MKQTHEEKLEYMKQWRANNRDRMRMHQRAYRARNKEACDRKRAEWVSANRDRLKEIKRDWYQRNKDRIRHTGRVARLRRLYSMSPEEFDTMLVAQEHKCRICKSDDPKTSRGWHVDHCHSTGRVRGILCNHCNLMLGYAQDQQATLEAAIDYLRG